MSREPRRVETFGRIYPETPVVYSSNECVERKENTILRVWLVLQERVAAFEKRKGLPPEDEKRAGDGREIGRLMGASRPMACLVGGLADAERVLVNLVSRTKEGRCLQVASGVVAGDDVGAAARVGGSGDADLGGGLPDSLG